MSNRHELARDVACGWVSMAVAMLVAMMWPGAVTAQTIDPNVIEFLPPANHSEVSRYDLAFYPADGGSAYLSVNIGKPPIQADGMVRVDLTNIVTAWPAPNVISTARVFSVVSTGAQASTHSNSFLFQCSLTLSASSQSFAAAGGTGSVSVTAPSTCSWNASSPVSWITVKTGATGTGSGSVAYSVAPNTATTSRTASLTIGGRTYTLTQAAGALTTTPPSACTATGTGSTPTIALQNAINNFERTCGVAYKSSPDHDCDPTNAAQTAWMCSTVPITAPAPLPEPCSFTLSASSQSFAAAGGTGSVSVTAPSTCGWTASSPVSWISVNAGTTGTGSGSVAYSVASNSATTSRTASLSIAGLTYTVTQAPGADAPKTSPSPSNVPPAVSITRPSAGNVINGRQVKIDASASDADGTIASVAFFVNGARVGTATKAPYSVQWASPASGTYTFTAQAIDNAGLTATSAPVTATVR